MPERSDFVKVVESWWEQFPTRSRTRGNISGGLMLIENLRTNFVFRIEAHRAERSDQLKNATRSNVQRILARFGEERLLLKEGGRTNRGLMRNLEPLLSALSVAGMEQLSEEDRGIELQNIQSFLAQKARDDLNAEKIHSNTRRG